MVYVIKFDGRKETFNKNKIIRTCLRAGVNKETAKKIADYVESIAYNGISTREIYRAILQQLDKYEKTISSVYRLREALSILPPRLFEIFIRRIFEKLGYNCKSSVIIQGAAVDHEVDVVAKRQGELILIECKHHVNPHRFCGLSVVLQVQARLEDILDGFVQGKNKYNFNKAVIVTNTKFSDHAIRYAAAKNIELIGWRTPKDHGLEVMIKENKIYPVTILRTKKFIIKKLTEMNIATIEDVNEKILRKIGVGSSTIENIIRQINKLEKI
jgi:signal recognition particle subunit SEC65